MQVESLVESIFICFRQIFIMKSLLKTFQHRSPMLVAQSEKRLFLFEGQALCTVTHLCITILIVLLLLVPMVIMQATRNNFTLQMICITLMSILFTVLMSGPMKARTAEIFGASAT